MSTNWNQYTPAAPQGYENVVFQSDGEGNMSAYCRPGGGSGTQGPQGPQGSNGTAGAQGAQGSQGSIGAQGATGAQGPQGYQGSTGAQGAQGATGAQGTQGPQGTQGVQGTQGSGGSSVTQTVGGFWSAGFPMEYQYGTSITGSSVGTTANQVSVWMFTLDANWTIDEVGTSISTNVSGATVNFGIYSSAGSKSLDSTALSATSTGAVKASISAVTLNAGTYFFAASTSNTSVQVQGFELGVIAMTTLANALTPVKVGQAANSTSAGVMPATLGTISADSLDLNIPGAFFFAS